MRTAGSTITVRSGTVITYPPRCAACNAGPDDVRVTIEAHALVTDLLLIVPIVGLGVLATWIVYSNLLPGESWIAVFAVFPITDVYWTLIRRRRTVHLDVPVCSMCAKGISPRSRFSVWAVKMGSYFPAAALLLLIGATVDESDAALRLLVVPAILIPSAVSFFILRRRRSPASALIVDDRINVHFKNKEFGHAVRELNSALRCAG